ncbi:hypothetical protein [Sinorhizobium meliloti]|uniref:hypothetical protein n=1 Tax=Rhizobium meliloti TaxID=382 RepID=UPI0003F500EC|nr:hypothetical protein [Sinorhizobium meliloti]MQX19789.1 hypothetical protein [Sinorhizobium meliloti]RVG18552.1 hypothetical protein CN231_10325 [Sinorhizobium meliloti]RVP13387.1 hypothetical protein CN085_18500 [Sinorhizobium meliloti]UFX07396.1 hypothetical protein SmelRRI128_13080 [Sinorhizobium meliloti]
MIVDFKYSLGDVVRTRRGDSGKVVAMSASEGRNEPLFRSYRLELDDDTQSWCPEFKIESVVGW